jgi:hypothetical protein
MNAEKLATMIETLDWRIEDALRDMARMAEALQRRADEALTCTRAALEGQPTSTAWVEFLEGNLRDARAAKERLDRLVEQKRMLQSLTKP